MLLEIGNQKLTTLGDWSFLVLILKELTNFISGLSSFDHLNPVSTRTKGIGIGDNLNHITRLEFGSQRHHTTINLGTCGLLTDLGMDGIGKVNRTWIFRQFLNSTIWCKDINSLWEDIFFYRVNKSLSIPVRGILEFHKILNPIHSQSRLFRIYLALDAFLVSPVSCNPVFGNLVHLLSTDLDFNRPFRSINRRMDRLITIGFRIGNIVFETSRHRTPELVDVSQHSINVTMRLHDTTNSN